MTRQLVALDLPGGPGVRRRPAPASGTAATPPSRSTSASRRRPRRRCSPRWPPSAVRRRRRHGAPPARRPPGRADGDALVMATSGSTGEPKGVVLTHDAVAASAGGVERPPRRHATTTTGWPASRWPTSAGSPSSPGRCTRGTRLTVLHGFDPRPVRRVRTPRWSPRGHGAAPHRPDAVPHDRARRRRRPRRPRRQRRHHLRHDRDRQRRRLRRRAARRRRASASTTTARSTSAARCCCAPTARRRRDPRTDGWLATGDLGRWLPDGRLRVDGRRGDLIITGGENVWPEPVERRSGAIPRVADVAVAGTPDDEWGQLVTAYVVPVAGRGADAGRAAPNGERGAAGVLRPTAARRGEHPHHAARQTTAVSAAANSATLSQLTVGLPGNESEG